MSFDPAQIERDVQAAIAAALPDAGRAMLATMAAEAPVKTGRMARSMYVSTEPGTLTVKVANTDPASLFTEFGFKHRTGRKRLIRRKGGGKTLGYSRSKAALANATYSEVAPNPWMRRGQIKALPAVIGIIDNAANNA